MRARLHVHKQASAGRGIAATVLAQLRAEQRDPAHGGCAAQIRGIDCDACVEVCPVDAIFADDQLPAEWEHYTRINADYYANKP
jgi:ferredoxin